MLFKNFQVQLRNQILVRNFSTKIVNVPKVPSLLLNDGNKIPQLGIGTWQSPKGKVKNAVYWAIKHGYRHIDCAYIYQNEVEVSEGIERAIQESLVKRDDLFITSKCWLTYMANDRVQKCFMKSLKDLKLEYLDLYLVHWPMAFKQQDKSFFPESNGLIEKDESVDFVDTWKAFEELKKSNLVRSIGVSNFNSIQLNRLLASCSIKPVCNQIEVHPYLNQDPLIKMCHQNDIQVVSYSPLGSTPQTSKAPRRLMDDLVVNELAKKHEKSSAQILIRYHIEKNLIVIPKSTNEERIKNNLNVFDFKLDKDDMDKLAALNKSYRFVSFDLKGLKSHKEYPF